MREEALHNWGIVCSRQKESYAQAKFPRLEGNREVGGGSQRKGLRRDSLRPRKPWRVLNISDGI